MDNNAIGILELRLMDIGGKFMWYSAERPSLNPMLNDDQNKQERVQVSNPSVYTSKEENVSKRNVRADKLKDIKFPVTVSQRSELRRCADVIKRSMRSDKSYETISNTTILVNALTHYKLFPERYPELEYADSGQYMHATPTRIQFDEIQELAIQWNTSIRKATHRLIMNSISLGEVKIRVTNLK
jgi:hypothetical protein